MITVCLFYDLALWCNGRSRSYQLTGSRPVIRSLTGPTMAAFIKTDSGVQTDQAVQGLYILYIVTLKKLELLLFFSTWFKKIRSILISIPGARFFFPPLRPHMPPEDIALQKLFSALLLACCRILKKSLSSSELQSL